MTALPENVASIPRNDGFAHIYPYNLRKQRIPSIVFFPEKAEEVADIVRHANAIGQKVVARCQGHSYASYSLGGEYGAWVIDLRKLDKIVVEGETASIGAGNSLGRITTKLYENGKKAIPTGLCLNVGIGGLTLHGGYGFTSRMWGLVIDAVEQVQVVLANGDVVNANRDHNRDLFFAILGAGSSFGIVTEFKMKLEDAPDGILYTLKWTNIPEPRARKEIVKSFQTFAKNDAPRNMSVRLRILQNSMEITGVYWYFSSGEHARNPEQCMASLKVLLSRFESLHVAIPGDGGVAIPGDVGIAFSGNVNIAIPVNPQFIERLPWLRIALYIDMEHYAYANEKYRTIVHNTDFQTFASAFLSTGACPELCQYFKKNDRDLTEALSYSDGSKDPDPIKAQSHPGSSKDPNPAKPQSPLFGSKDPDPTKPQSYPIIPIISKGPDFTKAQSYTISWGLPYEIRSQSALNSLIIAKGLTEEHAGVRTIRDDFLKIARLRKLNERSTFFTTSLFLNDEIPDQCIDNLFQFIDNPGDTPPPASHNWSLTIDTLGGEHSMVPEGRNHQDSCFSFRDSLFIVQFDTTTITGEPPFDPTGIPFCHKLRQTLIAQNPEPKMYYNFIDPEISGDKFWAYNYYDNEKYQRLKVLKAFYDRKCTFWTPQCIGAESPVNIVAAGDAGL